MILRADWARNPRRTGDNEALKRLIANPEVMTAIENIEGYRNIGKDVATIIARYSALKKSKKAMWALEIKEFNNGGHIDGREVQEIQKRGLLGLG